MPITRRLRLITLLLSAMVPAMLGAQEPAPHAAHTASGRRDSLSVMATVLGTRTSPAFAGRARTELLVTQPMLALRGARFGRALQYAAMLNAEHWTMPNGEPVAGIWGEGFIDRRHPHTVVHEVMVSGERAFRGTRVSISAGKGVIPFGTDDPMVRPFTKYPANHHFTQILERLQVTGAIRLSEGVSLEVAAFNGDEPVGTTSPPRWDRFGDSRSVRLSVWPVPQLEVQGSAAFVRSPEFASGAGLDQEKASTSVRWTPASGVLEYLLVEWARTAETYRSRAIVDYGTVLAEARATRRRVGVAIRLEQTSRPEEERLLDPFRTSRPPSDLTIRGVTRWQLASAQLAVALPRVRVAQGTVFTELTRAHSTPILRPVLLDPADISGSRRSWLWSVGLRFGAGAMPARVGRYGAAAGGGATNAMLTMTHQ